MRGDMLVPGSKRVHGIESFETPPLARMQNNQVATGIAGLCYFTLILAGLYGLIAYWICRRR